MSQIKIRFNTAYLPSEVGLKWRVLCDGKELLAHDVKILVPSETTEDLIEGRIKKWHISCEGELHWDQQIAIIRPLQA